MQTYCKTCIMFYHSCDLVAGWSYSWNVLWLTKTCVGRIVNKFCNGLMKLRGLSQRIFPIKFCPTVNPQLFQWKWALCVYLFCGWYVSFCVCLCVYACTFFISESDEYFKWVCGLMTQFQCPPLQTQRLKCAFARVNGCPAVKVWNAWGLSCTLSDPFPWVRIACTLCFRESAVTWNTGMDSSKSTCKQFTITEKWKRKRGCNVTSMLLIGRFITSGVPFTQTALDDLQTHTLNSMSWWSS